MRRIGPNKQAEVLKVLKKGGLVIFPSDTVYGLLVDATNEDAVKKLIEFKSRPKGKPISVFVTEKMLTNLVKINSRQRRTLETLLPGPFTIILDSKHKVSKLLESEKGTLGVRVPDYEQIESLAERFGKPVTATSANISGKALHHSVDSLFKQLSTKKKKLIDLIVDAGKLPRNKPSTIVDLTTATIRVLRKGDIMFMDTNRYISKSPGETKKIARKLLERKTNNKPLVFILQGELGVGKTIFVKGIGEGLGIENIISPTFVVYYEYDIKKKGVKKLIHVDLYNLTDPEEFKYLGLEKYLSPGNILCFEWGEKAEPLIDILRKKGKVIFVKMDYVNEKTRQIKISQLST